MNEPAWWDIFLGRGYGPSPENATATARLFLVFGLIAGFVCGVLVGVRGERQRALRDSQAEAQRLK